MPGDRKATSRDRDRTTSSTLLGLNAGSSQPEDLTKKDQTPPSPLAKLLQRDTEATSELSSCELAVLFKNEKDGGNFSHAEMILPLNYQF